MTSYACSDQKLNQYNLTWKLYAVKALTSWQLPDHDCKSENNSGFESQKAVEENEWNRWIFEWSLFLNISLKEAELSTNLLFPDSSAIKGLKEMQEDRIFNQTFWELIRNYMSWYKSCIIAHQIKITSNII